MLNEETSLRAKFLALTPASDIFSSFLPSLQQAVSKARESPTRPQPWTPLETPDLCPPGKKWRQRSRQLSIKVLPVPSSPRSKAKGQREARWRRAHSHPKRALTSRPFISKVGETEPLWEAGSLSLCLPLSMRPTGCSVSLQLALCPHGQNRPLRKRQPHPG